MTQEVINVKSKGNTKFRNPEKLYSFYPKLDLGKFRLFKHSIALNSEAPIHHSQKGSIKV